MKITRLLVFLVTLLLAAQTLPAQVQNADSMIHKVFATLKAKDQKAFIALYPNAQQFGQFMRNIMEQAMKSEEMKNMMALDEKSKGMNLDSLIEAQVAAIAAPEAFGKMEQAFGEMFQKIIEKGEKKGVKWSEAKLTSYTIDTASDDMAGAPFQPKGIKEAKGVIDFTVGADAYQLAYGKVMFLENEGGWFGAEFPQIARKGESLAPDPETGEETKGASATKKSTTGSKGKAPAAKGKTGGAKKQVRKKV